MKKLIWTAKRRRVSDLRLWKGNPRKITQERFENLKDRIRKRGFHDVVKIDIDGTILSGNQRKKALLDLNIKTVTTLVPSRPLTAEERNKVALESNSNDGEWDFEKLKSFDLSLLHDIDFGDLDLSRLWDEELEVKDEDFNIDEELKKIKKPKTKLGDLIHLGAHKLLCGDATDINNLKRLFGSEQASMIYSDPVYNINIDYNKGIGGKQNYGGTVNDNKSEADYRNLICKSLENALAVAKKDVHVFYWCDQTYIWLIQQLYRELGVINKRVCLWIKNSQNPTPGVAFNKCYEPTAYGVRGKPYIAPQIQNLNEVLNKEITTGNNLLEETLDELDIWLVKRLSGKEYEHATSKPPKLHEKAIRRCTKPGDIILDSFFGSASTLVAGEQLKRRVYGLELEPIFCDLAIARYTKLTGRKVKVEHV